MCRAAGREAAVTADTVWLIAIFAMVVNVDISLWMILVELKKRGRP